MRIRFVLLLVFAGCAVRLGGPGPVTYDTVGIQFEDGLSATDAAARLRELGTDLALIATRNDSVWVRQLAQALALPYSRPGKAGDLTLAFLGLKPIGDTTMVFDLKGGGTMRLHDALYNIDNVKKPTDPSRKLDLMTVVLDPGTNARLAVDTLLKYIATDVAGNAAVILAVQAATPAIGDTMVALTRAYMADAWECSENFKRNEPQPQMAMRLFYFPPVRIRCESARTLNTANRPVTARFIVP
jgi:hypothetical protein